MIGMLRKHVYAYHEPTQVQVVKVISSGEESMLEQLPWPALDCILQQLDPCSLACTAVTCSKLHEAVPAHISKVTMQRRSKIGSFVC
jgi:hypothetical protein